MAFEDFVATIVQTAWRRARARRAFLASRRATIFIQAQFRAFARRREVRDEIARGSVFGRRSLFRRPSARDRAPRLTLDRPSPPRPPRRALRGAPTQAHERRAHLARVARPRLPSRLSSRPGLRPRPRLESSRGRAPRGDARGEPCGCRRGDTRPPPPRRGDLPPGRVLPHTHAQARRGRLRVRAEGLRRGGSRRGEARRLRSSARPRRRSRRRKKNRRGGASFASRRPVPPRGARAERVAPASPRRARGADRGAAARGG